MRKSLTKTFTIYPECFVPKRRIKTIYDLKYLPQGHPSILGFIMFYKIIQKKLMDQEWVCKIIQQNGMPFCLDEKCKKAWIVGIKSNDQWWQVANARFWISNILQTPKYSTLWAPQSYFLLSKLTMTPKAANAFWIQEDKLLKMTYISN